jgi:hypothetical protein
MLNAGESKSSSSSTSSQGHLINTTHIPIHPRSPTASTSSINISSTINNTSNNATSGSNNGHDQHVPVISITYATDDLEPELQALSSNDHDMQGDDFLRGNSLLLVNVPSRKQFVVSICTLEETVCC